MAGSRMEGTLPALNGQPLSVRIGNLMGPASFWAVPTFTGCSAVQAEPLRQVLEMENAMALKFDHETRPLVPEGGVKNSDLQEGLKVAVRLCPTARHWYRGQVHSMIRTRHGFLARVFLLDYGELSEPINLLTCLRKLPEKFTLSPPPLAFQVEVAGLRPIAYDLNHSMGMGSMTQMIASSWGLAGRKTVRTLLDETNHRWAVLTRWTQDSRKIYHATVQLRGHPRRPDLHRVLIDGGFAFFDASYLSGELKTSPKSKTDFLTSNLSICGPRSVQGSLALSESRDLTMDDISVDETFLNVIEPEIVGPICNWERLRPFPRKGQEEEPKVDPNPKDVCQVKLKIREILKRNKLKRQNPLESIWEQFSVVASPKDGGGNPAKFTNYMRIPGGVDQGKFLQEQLERVESFDGIGPKILDPKMFCKN
eukprot:maker-scaffold578_size132436-snap-gene-0.28 protein:Tk11683 transcript:maker-scaffold578_size132436-snap-gene-0.28-mRNA-1 annotation:"tudor domain-containing protein 12"